jgi:hypothetical protein
VRGEDLAPLGLLGSGALAFPGILLGMVAARDAAPALATRTPLVTAAAESWATAQDGAVWPSATAAHQAARTSGDADAFAVAAADLANPIVLAGV